MKIKEYHLPIPHIIITDVFDDDTIELFLKETVKIYGDFKQGTFKRKGEHITDLKLKHAMDVHLDPLYNNRRSESSILRCFDKFLWDENMSKVYVESRYPIFSTISKTKKDNTHIIRYDNADFYNWHTDEFVEPYGFCTISYMLCSKNKKFTGGDFQLKWKNEIKTIKFKRNTMIIFPRSTKHKATKTIIKEKDPYYFRYTIQSWAS